MSARTWLRRLGIAVVGVYASLLALVMHRQVAHVSGLDLPWGLVVALGTLYVVGVAASDLDVQGVAVVAAAWFVSVVATMMRGGESNLLASDGLGLSYSVGAVVLLCALLFRTPSRR